MFILFSADHLSCVYQLRYYSYIIINYFSVMPRVSPEDSKPTTWEDIFGEENKDSKVDNGTNNGDNEK